jgi:glycosyltransferase involved in cell wall biosynthesis
MDKLSVSIITFNEERNIDRCLASVKEIADEIIVVDSFSTDKTKEICNKYKVTFSTNAFAGYIEQKNFALTRCSNKFVLSLDADEALSEALKTSILKEKEMGFADGYSFNRLTNYCGSWIRHSGWYPDVKLRLINKEKGVWSGLNPHDKFEFFEKTKTKHLAGDLLHYSYHSIEDHHKQVEYFTTIGATSYYKKGRKAGLLLLWFSPIAKFIRDYIINLGFLDGKAGWLVCTISAGATYKKYDKLRKLNKGLEI